MNIYIIESSLGFRSWHGDDRDHAIEQHNDAFPDEKIINIRENGDVYDGTDQTWQIEGGRPDWNNDDLEGWA